MADDEPGLNKYAALADRIEVHLTLDHSPGYHLSDDDQQTIVEALRIAAVRLYQQITQKEGL